MSIATEVINAISLVLALYAFVTALLLFVAQTENYNRVSHYWMQKGERAWIVIFNSSRRHLIGDDLYRKLSIDHSDLTIKKVLTSGEVEGATMALDVVSDKYVIDFSYMSPKSAIIAEFTAPENSGRPEMQGILKGGRLVKCFFWFDDPTHSVFLNLLAYIGFCVLVIGGLLYLRSVDVVKQGPFIVYAVATIILSVGVYLFFRKNRRIFVKQYREVRREMWRK